MEKFIDKLEKALAKFLFVACSAMIIFNLIRSAI